LAHLKEIVDDYLRLDVSELEGDLVKASKTTLPAIPARIYGQLISTRSALSDWEKSKEGA